MSVNIFIARPFYARRVYMLLQAMKSDIYYRTPQVAAKWDFSQCDRTFYIHGEEAWDVAKRLRSVYPGKMICVVEPSPK